MEHTNHAVTTFLYAQAPQLIFFNSASSTNSSTMLFVQAPAHLASSARTRPARCPPSMIRAPPSRPLPAAVPSRTVAPPSTTPAPTDNNNKNTSPNQAPQVTAAAVAVRAAAVAAAAAATTDSTAITTIEAPPAESSSSATSVKKSKKNKHASKYEPSYSTRERYLSRTSGRNQKYVRDSIENDRPAPHSIARMVAPDMITNPREHYFNRDSIDSTPSSSATLTSPPTKQRTSSKHQKQLESSSTSVSIASPAIKTTTTNYSGSSVTAIATEPTVRPRTRGRPKGSRKANSTTAFRDLHPSHDEQNEDDEINPQTHGSDSAEEHDDIEDDTDDDDEQTKSEKLPRLFDDGIRTYLSEIGNVKLLDADTEVSLARNIAKLLQLERLSAKMKRKNGSDPTMEEWAEASGMDLPTFRRTLRRGLRAKEHMVAANLRLVVSIAKKYTNRGLTFQDLIQEGSIGLIRGAEKFDANKGFKFSTYATWWIRQAITRAIADHSRPIRLPVHVNDTISSISKATKAMIDELGRPPTEVELSNRLKISVDKLQFIMRSSKTTISLETPMTKDGVREGANLGSLIVWNGDTPEETTEKTLLREDLDSLLNTLTAREREVVRMRYGLDDGRSKTLEEIGTTFAVTRERIRQIESKALRKLRHPNRNAALRDYVYNDM